MGAADKRLVVGCSRCAIARQIFVVPHTKWNRPADVRVQLHLPCAQMAIGNGLTAWRCLWYLPTDDASTGLCVGAHLHVPAARTSSSHAPHGCARAPVSAACSTRHTEEASAMPVTSSGARADPRLLPVQNKDTRTGTGASGGGGTTMSLSEVEPQLLATKTVTLTTRTAATQHARQRHHGCVAWCSALATLRHCPYCACRACDFCQLTVHHLIRWEEVLHQSRSMHSTSMQWTIRTGSPTASCSVAVTRMGRITPTVHARGRRSR